MAKGCVMERETEQALRGSIKTWEAIVAGTGSDHGLDDFPLCVNLLPTIAKIVPLEKEPAYSIARKLLISNGFGIMNGNTITIVGTRPPLPIAPPASASRKLNWISCTH
jgi:hypothetical protein